MACRCKNKTKPCSCWSWSHSQNGFVFETRLGLILASWEGTPYLRGQQVKGTGTDCVRFVFGVLDELYEKTTKVSTLPDDASLHNRERCMLVMRILRRQYPAERVESKQLQPGDVVVTGRAGPGHVLIVGPQKNTIWQADKPRVHWTGLGILSTFIVFRVYRPKGIT